MKSLTKSKVVIIILSVLLVLSLYFNAVLAYRLHRASARTDYVDGFRESELNESDLAPDFSVQLLTGETFTLSEQRGTVVVLNFWATWCGPCVAKMPALQSLSEQYEGRVILVGVNVGESQSQIRSFIDERGFTLPIGIDENMAVHKLYPSPGIPYTVIINRDGIVVDTILGGASIQDSIEDALR